MENDETASLIAGGASFALSATSLLVMSACPKFLIQLSLLSTLAWSLTVAVSFFLLVPHPGDLVGGILGVVAFLLSACYACVVWRRIPFAAANLDAALGAVKANAGVILVAYSMAVLSIGYSVLWMTALVGVYDKEGLCTYSTESDGTAGVAVCTESLAWGYLFLLLLAYFW
jgi:hypothetical protein